MDTKQTVQIVIGKWVLHYSIIASRVRRCTTHQPMRPLTSTAIATLRWSFAIICRPVATRPQWTYRPVCDEAVFEKLPQLIQTVLMVLCPPRERTPAGLDADKALSSFNVKGRSMMPHGALNPHQWDDRCSIWSAAQRVDTILWEGQANAQVRRSRQEV